MGELRVDVEPLDLVTRLSDSVAIAPGVMLPRLMVASAWVDGTIRARVEIETTPFGPIATKVCVESVPLRRLARGEDPVEISAVGVTGELLRKVPVGRIVSEAARSMVWVHDEEGGPAFGRNIYEIPDEIVAQWPNGDVMKFLRHATVIYCVATALGEGPTAQVAKSAGVSRATAGRIVEAARDARLLPPALEKGKATPHPEWEGAWVISLPANADEASAPLIPPPLPASPSRADVEAAGDSVEQLEIDRRRGK